jgi:PIN domain nuclease of toxin-antitoxin system
MLVAQASSEPMILITNDAVLGAYGPFVQVVRH